jgi:hypothetical protein
VDGLDDGRHARRFHLAEEHEREMHPIRLDPPHRRPALAYRGHDALLFRSDCGSRGIVQIDSNEETHAVLLAASY